jgi:hypothetical protein
VWENYADDVAEEEAKRRFETKREELRRQYGRDEIDQTPFAIRAPAPDYGRADAVAAKKRPEIEQEVAVEYADHKRAFREFIENVKSNDPVATALAQKHFLDESLSSFKKYVQLRKNGEVY